MKTDSLIILISFLAIGVCFGSDITTLTEADLSDEEIAELLEPDKTDVNLALLDYEPSRDQPKEYPQYLLVIRYWGSSMMQKGDMAWMVDDWIYLYESYKSIDEVIERLQTYTGPGMSAKEKDTNLVGLWKLGEDANIADQVLQVDEIKHEKQVKVETEEWTEIRWKKKGGKK